MTRAVTLALGLLGVIVVIALFSCFYFVNQTEEALVLQFGAPQAIVTDPGLHFKTPLTQHVVFFDRRVLTLDAPSEEVIASDKKRIMVDAFARWRIIDPLLFYQTPDRPGQAIVRLTPILSSNIRRVLGSQNFAAMLSGRRAELMHDIREQHEPGRQGLRHRGRRRAHPPCRPAAGEQPRDLSAHAEGTPARSGRIPRRGRRDRASASVPVPTREVTVILPRRRANPRSCAARATRKKPASSARPTARTPISSPSTAPCRPIRTPCRAATRPWCCRPTAISSNISATARAGNRARFGVPSHTRQSEANLTSALLASHTVRLGWRFANRRAVEVLFHMRQSWLAAAAISLSILVPAAACAAPAPAQAVVPVRGAPESFADLSAQLLPTWSTSPRPRRSKPNAEMHRPVRTCRPARRWTTCSRISSGRAATCRATSPRSAPASSSIRPATSSPTTM